MGFAPTNCLPLSMPLVSRSKRRWGFVRRAPLLHMTTSTTALIQPITVELQKVRKNKACLTLSTNESNNRPNVTCGKAPQFQIQPWCGKQLSTYRNLPFFTSCLIGFNLHSLFIYTDCTKPTETAKQRHDSANFLTVFFYNQIL